MDDFWLERISIVFISSFIYKCFVYYMLNIYLKNTYKYYCIYMSSLQVDNKIIPKNVNK